MGFFDDLTNFLNNLKPKSQLDGFVSGDFNNLLDTTEELSLDGINPLHSPSQTTDPRAISASQLDGIVQRRSGAFTQIILNPYQISKNISPQNTQIDQINFASGGINIGDVVFAIINGQQASYTVQAGDGPTNILNGLKNAIDALGFSFLTTTVISLTLNLNGTLNFTDSVSKNLRVSSTTNQTRQNISSTPITTLSKIYDIIGIDGDEPVTFTVGGQILTFPQGHWQSIPIQIPGTYLKIDYLPGKINWFDKAIDGTVISPPDIQFSQLDEAANSFSSGRNTSTQDPFTTQFMHRVSNRIMFIQFDSDSAPLIPIDSGDSFNVTFSSFILTFRASAPRIQILAGNNASIIKADNYRSDKMSLHAGPGYGMWDYPGRHATPFCFNHDTRNIPGATTFLNSGTGARYIFFSNQNSNQLDALSGHQTPDMGIATGWITGFNCRVGTSPGGAAAQGSISIYINSTINSQNPDSGNFKLLYQNFFQQTSQPQTLFQDFSVPIRFTLRPGDSLEVLLNNEGSDKPLVVGFCIYGYVFGRYFSNGSIPAFQLIPTPAAIPQFQIDTLTTAPFPLDLLYSNS